MTRAPQVLVAYATKHGSTHEVAEAVAERLRAHGLDVTVQEAGPRTAVAPYDAVVLGGALYTGRVHRDARHFLTQHREELAGRPFAIFAMGPMTLEADDVASSRRQLDRALAAVPEIEPVAVAVFGGVVDPSKLRFPMSHMEPSDARDWDAIRAWGDDIAARLGAAPAPGAEPAPARKG